jgi:hypothetical protein
VISGASARMILMNFLNNNDDDDDTDYNNWDTNYYTYCRINSHTANYKYSK